MTPPDEDEIAEAPTSPLTRMALLAATAFAIADLAIGGLIPRDSATVAVVALMASQAVARWPAGRSLIDRFPASLLGVALIAISMPVTNAALLTAAAFLLGVGWTTVSRALAPLFASVFLVLIASTRVPIDEHLLFLLAWGTTTIVALVGLTLDGASTIPALGELGPKGRVGATVDGAAVAREAGKVVVVLVLVVPVLAALLARAPGGPPARRGDAGRSASAYWGFEDRLDTGVRGQLGDDVVMRVRSAVPDLWRGQTFDEWDGRAWSRSSDEPGLRLLGDLVVVPPGPGDLPGAGGPDGVAMQALAQTVTVDRGGNDLVFASYRAAEIDLPVDSVEWFADGSLRTDRPLGARTTYTVTSLRPVVTPDLLRRHDPRVDPVPDAVRGHNTDATVLSARARALGREITAGAPTTYDAIRAMESWMAANLVYSRDLEPLPPGADAVDRFLFEERRGFCEQIATVLALWLRDLGVPARVAAGYAPDEQNPITGEWVVRERDAHAWVEVYFPGVGWQGFDPTASVPLSGEPSPGAASGAAALLAVVGRGGLVVAGVGALLWLAAVGLRRWTRARGASVDHRRMALALVERVEAAGQRRGAPRDRSLTFTEYTEHLRRGALPDDRLTGLARTVSTTLYGGRGGTGGPADEGALEQARVTLDAVLRSHPVRRRRRGGRA